MDRRGDTGRARVHFPCTHTPSTIRRPLAASTWNAIPRQKARGTRQMAEGGSEGGGEDKIPGIEAGEV